MPNIVVRYSARSELVNIIYIFSTASTRLMKTNVIVLHNGYSVTFIATFHTHGVSKTLCSTSATLVYTNSDVRHCSSDEHTRNKTRRLSPMKCTTASPDTQEKRKTTLFDDYIQPQIPLVGQHFDNTAICFQFFFSEPVERPAPITFLAKRDPPKTTLEGNMTI